MDMPILRPLKIPTKECNALKRAWRWLTTTRQWEVVADYSFQFRGRHLFIPKGFIFDGASIPRIFWMILSPTGLLLIPGLFHDYGYRYDYLWEICFDGPAKCFKGSGKAFWDKLFMRIGQEVNGVHFVNHIAWLALAAGGWWAWKTNRQPNVSEVS